MTKYKIAALLIIVTIGCLNLNSAKAQDQSSKKWSYFNKNKLNFLSGGNNYKDHKAVNLSTIHGVHLSDRFATGIGVGLTDGLKYPSPIIPIFLNGTLSLTERKKLYLSGDLGYSIATEDPIKGGLLGEIGIGWKFRIGKIAIAPEIGYRYDGFKDRALEMIEGDGFIIYRPTGKYISDHINSFSTGISIFF